MSENEEQTEPLVSPKASKYFPVSAKAAGEALAKTALKTRGKIKPDLDEDDDDIMPEDGDVNAFLALENQDSDYEYFWVSDEDRGRYANRPWEVERWSPVCCRPKNYFGVRDEGSEVRFRELTLFRMRKEAHRKMLKGDWRRRQHAKLVSAISAGAKESGGSFTATTHYV